ncbi:hypothetical protein L2E82_27261 [Cichorium intybus]|uniref:Uncharacterized protein n=1 Tax=Cichorium intybus TaxID=13427 RepID=A0ACB9CSG8_CICIN|nr:hypothetical protein L2E82_27261 [Cichorium intybus]
MGKVLQGIASLECKCFNQNAVPLLAVTSTCELKTTTMDDGHTLNVIDTPEIVSCIHKARDGIDAFLVVLSACTRFAEDEKAAINSLLNLFGRKVYDYMIVVFTGGDALEGDNVSLEEFLCESPKALQEILWLCGNRCVLFDNKTKDPTKRSNQVQELLNLVNMVSKNNEGKPYTNEIFTEMKIERKLKDTTLKFEKLLEEERIARLKTEEEIQKLRQELEEARKREEEHQKKGGCNIL